MQPACDTAQEEDELSFRSVGADGQGPNCGTVLAAEEAKGAPVSSCPDCGSHWTMVGNSIVVHLAAEVADGVLDLATSGDFFYGGKYGSVTPEEARCFGDGYSMLVHPEVKYASELAEPDYAFPRRAVLRLVHGKAIVDVRVPFIDNKTKLLADPPAFE